MIRPGLTVADADNVVRKIISDNDVGARLITRAGYSIGIAFPPSWDEGYILSLKQGNSRRSEGRHDLPHHPLDVGRRRRQDRRHLGHHPVTEDGCESFFDFDEDFVCKPEEAGKAKSNVAEFAKGQEGRSGMNRAIDPTTGQVIREVETADASRIDATLATADDAFRTWRKASFEDRAAVLHGGRLPDARGCRAARRV